MAVQGKVTDFFANKKRNADAQPSKRRKVKLISSETNISSLDITNKQEHRKCLVDTIIFKIEPTKPENEISVQRGRTTAATSKTAQIPNASRSTRKNKCIKLNQKGQRTIDDVFARIAKESSGVEDGNEEGLIVDETTSSWDDHDGPSPSSGNQTPVRSIQATVGQSVPSRKRRRDAQIEESKEESGQATPLENLKPTTHPETSKSRRKIDLVKIPEKKMAEDELDFMLPRTPPPVSPLHKTPEKIQTLKVNLATDSCRNLFKKMESMVDKPSSAEVKINLPAATEVKVKFSAAEIKAMLSPAEVKARLAKAGKLDQLKEQLVQLNKNKAELEKTGRPKLKKFDEIKVKVDAEISSAAVPAYEKYHSLAAPTPPSLTLPYKYKLLAEMFRSMDTIVNMLHNRSEICTFSKLKAAVEKMTRRNFEQKNVGQIKTVYPTAYHLRQEKGLPTFGKKTTCYELTIEINLSDCADAVNVKTEPNTRPMFTAKHLLQRKDIFHWSLIRIVKQYHREFLSKLAKPLTIPDDKITRWHPRFQLDLVPDVEAAPLPEAHVEKKYQTAKDVLECRRGHLLPKVEKALEEVCKESETSQPVKMEPPTPVQNTTATKGIPQSLLEKIRAKEAKKLEMSLTRDSKEDKKIERMKRLPGMMRIIRTHFVTEKKPALPLEHVIQKLTDSFHSCISYNDVEDHVKLIVEILPEWMTIVEIKRGKFLKIDKNLDLQTVIDKVKNMIKTCS